MVLVVHHTALLRQFKLEALWCFLSYELPESKFPLLACPTLNAQDRLAKWCGMGCAPPRFALTILLG